MKKALLPVFAFMLAVSAANAQTKISRQVINIGQTAPTVVANHQIAINGLNKQRVMKAAPNKALAANQKYVGMSGVEDPVSAIGLPGYSPTDFAQLIPASYFADYVGCKVVGLRFLTMTSTQMTPSIMTLSGQYLTTVAQGKEVTTQASPLNASQTAFEQHWNEVTFDKPYTIGSDFDAMFVSFAYTQSNKSTGFGQYKEYADECYPFLVAQNTDQNAAIYANGDFGSYGNGWTGVNNSYCMCVQLIVEKDGGFVDDFSMTGITTNPMAKPSETLPLEFSVKNLGSKDCNDYEFGVLLNNKEIGTITSAGNGAVSTSGVVIDYNLDLSKYNLADGVHTVGVKVNKVNGAAPAGNLDDDLAVAEFRTYSESTDRQYNLLEHFTSWTCVYCPWGYNVIRTLQKQRDDVAWVAIHQNQSSDNPDPNYIEDAEAITAYSISGFPSANLNRFNLSGSNIGAVISAQDAEAGAKSLSQVLDMEDQLAPSLVHLDMNANLKLGANPANDPAKLTLTVTGKGVKNASKILDTAVLGVYITENGLTGNQYGINDDGKTASWKSGYSHENTLIAIPTESIYGDQIAWNGDNFEKTYDITIPNGKYDYKNGNTLNAVAFVSLPFVVSQNGKNYFNGDIDNVWVNQCVFATLNEGETTGISSVSGSDANATVVARYAADGTQIDAPVKGINILKMSDGTTRKVIVNK